MQTPLQRGFQSGCIFLRSTQISLPARNLSVKRVMEGLNLQLEETLANFTGVRNPQITHFCPLSSSFDRNYIIENSISCLIQYKAPFEKYVFIIYMVLIAL